MFFTFTFPFSTNKGGLAQLARAPALHAGGQRFESVILHLKMRMIVCLLGIRFISKEFFDVLDNFSKVETLFCVLYIRQP